MWRVLIIIILFYVANKSTVFSCHRVISFFFYRLIFISATLLILVKLCYIAKEQIMSFLSVLRHHMQTITKPVSSTLGNMRSKVLFNYLISLSFSHTHLEEHFKLYRRVLNLYWSYIVQFNFFKLKVIGL